MTEMEDIYGKMSRNENFFVAINGCVKYLDKI